MGPHLNHLRSMIRQVDPSFEAPGLRENLESLHSSKTEGLSLESRRLGQANAEMAIEALDLLRTDGPIDHERRFALEAIVMPYHRPVVDIIDDKLKTSDLTQKWQHLAGESLRPAIESCLLSVGRINVPSQPSRPYAGTGFIVGPNLLMTNRHVAAIFSLGLGNLQLQFLPGQVAEVDFYRENGRVNSEILTVENIVMIHPYWDMALLRVSGLPESRHPLTLSTSDPASLGDREVVVIGYPGYDDRPDEEFQRIQNRIFRGTYYVKRLQPGCLRTRERVESFNRRVEALTHDCSTLGGNSGSAVLILPKAADEHIQVVGLHFGGTYLVANYAAPTYDMAQDSRIVDAGVRFSDGRPAPRNEFYHSYWSEADELEQPPEHPRSQQPQVPPSTDKTSMSNGTNPVATLTIPLQVTISIGNPTQGTSLAAVASSSTPVAPATILPPTPKPAVAEGLFGKKGVATSQLPYAFAPSSMAATSFRWQTALALALASRLAYEESAAVSSTAAHWGLDGCKFLEADDTQCFIASTKDLVLISFRGTASVGDWLVDLDVASSTRPYGLVHRGFLRAFQVIEKQLLDALTNIGDRPLVLTGHSLGGALATVAAAEWRERFRIGWIYTYGQPAVGKGQFEKTMQPFFERFIRFVNDDDVVAQVPPTYRHVGRLFRFDAKGNLPPGTESPRLTAEREVHEALERSPPMLSMTEFDLLRARLLENRAMRVVPAVEAPTLEPLVLEGLLPSVRDHFIDGYIAKIVPKA